MKKSVNQLVEYFEPVHYWVQIDARPGRKTFSGAVGIYGNKKGEFVRLHAKGLKFTDWVRVNEDFCEVVELENDEIELRPKGKPHKNPEEFLKKQKWFRENKADTYVSIHFEGEIKENSMHGLYPCYYEIGGERRELLATQFESHHAREMFPCVDEPVAKATFEISVDTDPDLVVLSNMPVAVRQSSPSFIYEYGGERQELPTAIYHFEPTPRMSTYLLALVIGDLWKKTARTKDNVEVSVYATPAQSVNSMDFALDTAVRAIEFYDEYFGTKYPLPKSDHVALPDFSAGAMENWGLVTYRETALLVDNNAAISTKQYVATVIAHELSHMWFGDLVTMKWWNDLWLNESFASLMEHICTDALFPNWDMWANFETGDVISALKRDALPGVQSVRQDVHHPDEISTLFDPAIVYAKGERLLKMLRAFIGENAFRKGLCEYFKKHAYSNTTADDLWRALSNASGQDVSDLMTPWLTRPGYPVIFASCEGDKITLRQERFFANGESDDTLWQIPLFCSNENAPKLMTEKEISFASGVEDFQLNIGNNSHFITIYDEVLSKILRKNLHKMSVVDRAKVLNELLLVVVPGLAPTNDLLDLLPTYADETETAVWDVLSLALATIGRFVEPDSDDEKRLKKLAGDLARKQYECLGWVAKSNESINDQKLRPTILSQVIYAEERAAIDKALEIYVAQKRDLSEINGDLRPTVLGAAVRYGDREEFAYMFDIYKTSQNADLKSDICAALTATHDAERIDEILGFLNKTNIVKPQDLPYWFSYMLGNRRARAKTWDWCRENWTWIAKTFSGDKSYDIFPRYAGARLATRNELSEFDEFFADKIDDLSLKRAIEVGHNDIATRVEWLERDRDAVLEKLKNIERG
ncbi:M1 family metallopeptidase [Candidatus Saccharibacteria bacterium]|nr:M1 family metallopeptidase [Candidatus Saccharibacteria bacterium]MCL1963017.1 M1 family metallopeptidase [Candidatus Saccharibacteria bacterium]